MLFIRFSEEIKKSSDNFIKEENLSKFRFNWQEGFGAFSYSHSQLDDVIKYIINQKRTSQEKNIQNGIHRLFKKIQSGIQ